MPTLDPSLLLTAGAIAGALLSIYKVYRPCWAFIKRMRDSMLAGRRLESQVQALASAVQVLSQQCESISAQLRNNGGSSVKDALDRIEARQSIAEQRQRIQLSDSQVGILETDADGRCIWVNRAFCMLTERLPEELLGYGWRNVIAPDERERILREFDNSTKEQRGFERYYHIQTTAGDRVRIFARTQKLVDGRGHVAGWVKTVERTQVISPDYFPSAGR